MGFKVKLLILVVANVAVPVAVMFPPIALVKFKLVMLAKVAVRLDIVAVKAFSKLVNRFVEVALVVTKSVMVALAILRPVTVAPDKSRPPFTVVVARAVFPVTVRFGSVVNVTVVVAPSSSI